MFDCQPGHRVIITLYDVHDQQERDVKAWTTATPGLLAHESMGDPGWIVTHQRSGLCVAMFDDPEQAQAFAALVGSTDWTRSGQDLISDPTTRTIVSDAIAIVGNKPHILNYSPRRADDLAR